MSLDTLSSHVACLDPMFSFLMMLHAFPTRCHHALTAPERPRAARRFTGMAPKKAARGNTEPWSETPAPPWMRASRAAMQTAAPLRHFLDSAGGDRWAEYGEVMGDLGLTEPEPVARSAAAGSGAASSSSAAPPTVPHPGAKSPAERQADTYRELLFDCSTRPANFDPRRHTIYVLGRPVQVLSHEF